MKKERALMVFTGQRSITSFAAVVVGLVVILVVSGCGKKDAAPAVPAAIAATPPAPAEPPPPPQVQVSSQPAPQVNGEPDLAELNRNLIRWIARNRRRP